MQAVLGPRARWGTQEHLTAALIDAVNLARVQATNLRVKRKLKFEPFPRPGDEPKRGTEIIGRGDGMTLAEIDAWLKAGITEEVPDGSGS